MFNLFKKVDPPKCTDCKFLAIENGDAVCNSPHNIRPETPSGLKQPMYMRRHWSADFMRRYGRFEAAASGMCGARGAWFKPKETQND